MRNFSMNKKLRRLKLLSLNSIIALVVLLTLTACADTTNTTTGTTTMSTTTATTTNASTGATTVPTTTTTGTMQPRPKETTLVLKLEGGEEPIKAMLFESDLGYSMYYDNQLHKISRVPSSFEENPTITADRFEPKIAVPNDSNAYIEIGHFPSVNTDNAITKIQQVMTAKYHTVNRGNEIGIGVDKTTAAVIEANNVGIKSELAHLAVISDGKNGSYYFYHVYTMIVAEGHRARINQMLDTFRIE
jgi:hypothetical protein